MKKLFLITIFIGFTISCQKSTDAVSTYNYDNLEINSSEAKNNFIEGMKESQNKNYNKAKIFFEKANNIEGNNTIIINGLANTVNILGDINNAENLYKTSLSIDSSFIQTYINYGNLLIEQKRFDESKKILLKGLNRNSSNGEKIGLYLNLGLIMKLQNDCPNAQKYAEMALESSINANINIPEIINFINEIKNCK